MAFNPFEKEPTQGFNPFVNTAPVSSQKDNDSPGFWSGIKSGVAGTLAGQAHFFEANTGIGGDTANYLDEIAQKNQRTKQYSGAEYFTADYLTNPQGLRYTAGSTIGSAGALMAETAGVGVLASMLPGGAVTGGAAAIASRFPTLARFAGTPLGKLAMLNVAKTPFEAASEGGNIVPEMRNAGYSEDEIKSATRELAAYNMLFLTASNTAESAGIGWLGKGAAGLGKQGLGEIGKRGAIGAAGGGLQNAFEERTQTALSNDVMGKPTGNWYNPFSWTQEEIDAAAEGGFGGAVIGGSGGVVGAMTGRNNHPTQGFNPFEERPAPNIDGQALIKAGNNHYTSGGFEAFVNAISGQESGGNYDAVNGRTGAAGKYQIMPENWPSWSQEAGLPEATPMTPESQEKVARYKLKQYYDNYGPRGAAIAWYAGEGALNYSGAALSRKQGSGDEPSINEYADSILHRMGDHADVTPAMGSRYDFEPLRLDNTNDSWDVNELNHPLNEETAPKMGAAEFMKASEAPHMPIVDEGFKEKPAYKYAKMDPISESDAMAYHQATGLDLNGYQHEITSHEVKHALKQHGGDSERLRGQIPITREDFSLLPEITRPENIVGVEKGKRKQDIILYEKRVNGHILAVEEVLVGRQTLRFLSMRKRPSAQLNVGRNTDPVSHVQDGRSLASSDSSVPNLPPSVNGKGKEYMAATSGMTVPSNSPRPVNPGGEAVTGTVTRKQIVDKVNDFFTKVSTGRLGVRGVLGWFDRDSEVIRTKDYADFRTIMHEIGHYLDKGLGLRKDSSFDSELISAVQRRFRDAYNDLPVTGRRGEGIAEFFHDYTTNPSRAKQEFPQYYAAFEQHLAQEPVIRAKVNEVRQMLHTWYNQSSEARVKGSISFGDGSSTVHKAVEAIRNPVDTTKTILDKGKQAFESFYDNMIDQLAPLDRMMKEIERVTGEKLPMMKDVFKRAWLSRGWAGKAQTLIERGLPEKGIPSLKSIVKLVEKDMEGFAAYVVALREVDAYNLEGKTPGLKFDHAINSLDAFNTVVSGRKRSEFVKAQQELVKFNNHLLDILVDAGIKDADSVAIMKSKWPNYVPFFREFSDAAVERFLSTKGFGNISDPVKQFKGSTRDIINPLESIIKNTYQFINLAERNKVGQLFVELAQKPGLGKILEEVSGSATSKDSTFSVWNRGQKRVFQTTPELYRAIMMLDKPAAEGIVKILQIPAGWLRAGAVLSPEFIMRNPVRDSWTAFINTKYGFIPGIDTMRGLAHFMKKDDLYWEYMNSGAAHATMVSLDRDYLARNIRQFMKTSAADKAIAVINPRTYLEVLRSFSEATEMATRLAEYENAKRGYSGVLNRLFTNERTYRTSEEAALGARDVTLDFSRSGSNEYGKFMNKTVAFWNATVQGTDKMIRSFKDNPVGFSSRVFMSITLPSIVLYYMNRDDPRYQELPQWQKDLFWIIPTKDTLIRIPKPFEMGILFGTSVERMLQWMDSKDKSQAAAKKQLKSFGGTVGEALMPSWIPTAALPIIEWLTNYSMFMDRNLVSPSQEKLPNKLQYGPNTSAVGKYVGEKLDVSPAKVDNTIRGYTGGLGSLGMFAGDAIAGEFDKRPAMRISEMPGVRAFTATPYKSSQSVQEFYDEYQDQEKLYNEWKQTGNKPDGYDPARYQRLKAVDKIIDEIHKAQKQVMADTKMSSEAKRQRLDKLQLQAVDVARAGLWKPKIATK